MKLNYWEKRSQQNELVSLKKTKDIEKELTKEYLIAKEEIKDKIFKTSGRYKEQNNLNFADMKKLLTKQEKKDLDLTLRVYKKKLDNADFENSEDRLRIQNKIDYILQRKNISRLQGLLTEVESNLYLLGAEQENKLKKVLIDNYKSTYKSVGIALKSKTVLPVKQIERMLKIPWSGLNYSEAIWNNTNQLAVALKREMTQGFIQGINIQKMAKNINDRMQTGLYNATRLARTEMNHALNEATFLNYEESEIEEYEILVTDDDRLSEICRKQSGKIYKVKDRVVGVNAPPFHPNCRTTTIPVIK